MKPGWKIYAILAAGLVALKINAPVVTAEETERSPSPSNAQQTIEIVPGVTLWSGYENSDWASYFIPKGVKKVAREPVIDGGVLFLGDSITESAPFEYMFPGITVANHGVPGDTSAGALHRLALVTQNTPERVFIKIGTNDLNYGYDAEAIASNVFEIADRLHQEMQGVELYVISLTPREKQAMNAINKANQLLQAGAVSSKYTFLNIAPYLKAADGAIDPQFSSDSLHLNTQGYKVWAEKMDACVRQGCKGL